MRAFAWTRRVGLVAISSASRDYVDRYFFVWAHDTMNGYKGLFFIGVT